MNDDKQQPIEGAMLAHEKWKNATANLPRDEQGLLLSKAVAGTLDKKTSSATSENYINFNRQFSQPGNPLIASERNIISTTMGLNPEFVMGAGGMNAADAAKVVSEQLGLGDQSVGINVPAHVGSEKARRVATSVQTSSTGPHDYRQYEYGTDDWRGAQEGGQRMTDLVQQGSFGAGTTSTSQIYGDFRPMDGNQGNPYYLTTASSPAYTTVAPFKVKIPDFDLEVNSATTDPEKLAFNLATAVQGMPLQRFIGYKKVPELKESLLSATIKATQNIPEFAVSALVGAGNWMWQLADAAGVNSEYALQAAEQRKQWWNKNFSQKYYDIMNSEVWGDNPAARLGSAIPSAAASFAAIVAANVFAGPAGAVAAAALLNAGEGVDISLRAQEHGVSPQGSVWSGMLGVGLISALDTLGVKQGNAVVKAAISDSIERSVARAAGKRVASNAMRFAGDVAWEGGTEGAQELVSKALSRDLFDADDLARNLTDVGIATLVGGMMRFAAAPFDIAKFRAEGSIDRIIQGRVTASSSELEKALNAGVDVIAQAGGMDRATAFQALMDLYNNPKGISKFIQDAINGELDKMNPETIKAMERLPKWLKNAAAENFKSLDAAVLAQLPDTLPESTKKMVTRAMRGIVSVIGAYRGGRLNLPTFRAAEKGELAVGENAKYDPTKNELVINSDIKAGQHYDSPYVKAENLPKISAADGTLLHELGHYLDVQLGIKGRGFKEFLPTYFGLLSKVYGEQKSGEIKAAYAKNKGQRFVDVEYGKGEEIKNEDTTEWFAHAFMRMGSELGKEMGLEGEVADYINIANIMGRHLLLPSIQEAITNLRNTIDTIIKRHETVLTKMVDQFGEDGLAQKINDYLAGDQTALSTDDVQALYNMLTTYVGSKDLQVLKNVMPGKTPELFMERTRREFQEAIAEGVTANPNEDINADAGKPLPRIRKRKALKPVAAADSVDPFADLPTANFSGDAAKFMRTFGFNSSPQAQYDTPSTEAIGTGEGGIAHGWGLYYLENKSTDKSMYWLDLGLRKGIMPVSIVNGGAVYKLGPSEQWMLADVFISDSRALQTLRKDNGEYPIKPGVWYGLVNRNIRDMADDFLLSVERSGIELDTSKPISVRIDMEAATGQIQKVLLPDTDEVLHEGMALKYHSPYIDKALKKLAENERGYAAGVVSELMDSSVTARDLYKSLSGMEGGEEAASKLLSKYGIKGIAYDGRRDGKGMVVFTPEALDVVETIRGNENIVKYSRVIDPVAKAQAAAKQNAVERQKTDIVSRATEKIDGRTFDDDAELMRKNIASVKKTPKLWNKVIGSLSTGSLDNFLWLFGGTKLGEQFPLAKLFNRKENIAFEQQEAFENKIIGKGKLFENRSAFDRFSNEARLKSIEAKDVWHPATHTRVTRMISPANAMNVYLRAKNELTRPHVMLSFFNNEANMQAVIDALTPEQKAFADAMQEDRMEHWNEYRKSYADDGVVIDQKPYWPSVAAARAIQGDRIPNSEFSRDLSKLYPMDISEVDAFELFSQQIHRSAGAESGFYKVLRRVKDLIDYKADNTTELLDPENQAVEARVYKTSQALRTELADKVGDAAILNNFTKTIDDFISNTDSREVDNSVVSILSRNAITNLFIFKPIQLFKQFTQAVGFYGLAQNQALYWENTSKALSNLPAVYKEMTERSALIRRRMKGKGLDEQLSAAAAQGGDSVLMKWAASKSNLKPGTRTFLANFQQVNKSLQKVGLTPMVAGDVAANIIGGYGLLKDFDARYPNDPKRAVEEFEIELERHQTNTNQALKSYVQRSWNRDYRGQFIAMTSDTAMKLQSIFKAMTDVYRGERTPGSAALEISSTTMAILIFALVSAGIWDLFDDDPENDDAVYDVLKSELISNALGISPLSNSFVAPVVSSMFTDYDYQAGTPLTSLISKMSRQNAAQATAEAIAAAGIVTPLARAIEIGQGAARQADESPEKRESGRRMIYGRSKSASERRAGVKKDVEKKDDED